MICKWIFLWYLECCTEPSHINFYQMPPQNILSKSNNAYHFFFLPKAPDYSCLKPFKSPVILLVTQASNLYPPLAPTRDTSSTCLGIHLPPCYVWKKKILRKAWRRLMKHLLKHLRLDRADAATTAQPLGRLKSTLGKREEMGECYASLRELPQKLTVFFLLIENADCFFFLLLSRSAFMLSTVIASLSYLLSCSHLCKTESGEPWFCYENDTCLCVQPLKSHTPQ